MGARAVVVGTLSVPNIHMADALLPVGAIGIARPISLSSPFAFTLTFAFALLAAALAFYGMAWSRICIDSAARERLLVKFSGPLHSFSGKETINAFPSTTLMISCHRLRAFCQILRCQAEVSYL